MTCLLQTQLKRTLYQPKVSVLKSKKSMVEESNHDNLNLSSKLQEQSLYEVDFVDGNYY